MKRLGLCLLLCLVLSCGMAVAETPVPSIVQKNEPVFFGLGFSLMGGEYVVTEVSIEKVVTVDLKNKTESDQKSFKATVLFGDDEFPLNIINPELNKFEADIVELGGGEKELTVPIGHISFELQKPDKFHPTAIGKLIIKSENISKSGDYKLMLNELPALPPSGAPGGADMPPIPSGK